MAARPDSAAQQETVETAVVRLQAAARHVRRDDGPRWARARPLAAAADPARRARREGDPPALCRRRSPSARFRRVLSRLRGSLGRRAAVAAEPRAAADRAGAMADAQGRPRSARRAARGGARRCLRIRGAGARGPAAGRRDRRQSGIPASAGRRRAARRRPSAVLCGRRRALARRRLVGAQRPHPGALGQRLCARESPGVVARAARRLSLAQGRAAGAVLPGPAGRAHRRSIAAKTPASACSRRDR